VIYPTLTYLADASAALVHEVGNHDELTGVGARARPCTGLPPKDAAALAVGLNLFSEIKQQHRDLPLLTEFATHFKAFMQSMKQRPGPADAPVPVQH